MQNIPPNMPPGQVPDVPPGKVPYFLTRIIEMLVITFISSFPMYILARFRLIPSTLLFYIILFGLSAGAFLYLNAVVLREYLVAVEHTKTYLITNGILFVIQVVLCMIGLKFFSSNMYTMFFGFTKPFRGVILWIALVCGGTPAWLTSSALSWMSAGIFWLIYLFEIIYIPIDRAKIRDEIRFMEALERLEQEDEDL